MKNINGLADELISDTLKEAADTFFGRRRNIEYELSLFEQKVNELRSVATKVEKTVKSFNFLLLQGREVENFWNYLKITFPLNPGANWLLDIPVPFGLTISFRYVKLLVNVYIMLSQLIEEYSYGKEVKSSGVKGQKMITVNYNFLQKWASEINKNIDDVNYYHKPSDVLQFAKKMQVAELEKANIAGAPMKYSIDKDMTMKRINFLDYKLIEYPDLSRDKETLNLVKQFARDLIKKNKQEVKFILDNIQG
jgi:hypothetical protein